MTMKAMQIENANIASLGYRLETADDVDRVRPLLDACGLQVREGQFDDADEQTYLVAATPAGGVAAAVGWALYNGGASVIHSLSVAPSSRGGGLGASLLASTMLHLREEQGVENIYIGVHRRLASYFSRLGFVGAEELPESLVDHPIFEGEFTQAMARRYGVERHGLDQSAFCLIHNTTDDATLPVGSVFWFRQSSAVLEAQYRGGRVGRGQLLGAMEGGTLRFLWQACTTKGELMRGDGEIHISTLDDGRRELRETLGEDPGELLLREF